MDKMNIINNIILVVPYTLLIALLILLIGLFGGAIVAFIRSKDYVFISSILNLYVSFTRGVPIVVQLLIGQALLPKVIETLCKLIGKEYQQQNFPILLVVLICYGSYQIVLESENLRGIYQAIDIAQVEAGYSIGLTTNQILRRIVIPQLLPTAFPIVLNSLLKIVKSLSVAFLIGFVDIMAEARYEAALSSEYIFSFFVAGIIYWIICLIFQFLISVFHRDYTIP